MTVHSDQTRQDGMPDLDKVLPKAPDDASGLTGNVIAPPTEKRGRKGMVIGTVATLVAAGVAGGAFFLGRQSGGSPEVSSSRPPAASGAPVPGVAGDQIPSAPSQPTPESSVTSLPKSTEKVPKVESPYAVSVEQYPTPETAIPKLFEGIEAYWFSGNLEAYMRGTEAPSEGKEEILSQLFSEASLGPDADTETRRAILWLKSVSKAATERAGLGKVHGINYTLNIDSTDIKKGLGNELMVGFAIKDSVKELPYEAVDLTQPNAALLVVENVDGQWKIVKFDLQKPTRQ